MIFFVNGISESENINLLQKADLIKKIKIVKEHSL